ncbi:hypothetical protein BDW68DRAFT_185857 [Aspergillus falconensis]
MLVIPPLNPATIDSLPACFRRHDNWVEVPRHCLDDFLSSELSLKRLEVLDRHLWFAGTKRPPKPLHYHVLIGREIIITEQMDLHLLWANDGRMFIKPLPRYLLSPEFWSENLSCLASCRCQNHPAAIKENNTNAHGSKRCTNPPLQECQRRRLWKCAMGFLYTYACLVSYESDFLIAIDKHLLPQRSDGSTPRWEDWKKLVAEILACHNQYNIHPRFHRGELRLSRLDTIHRFTQLPPFEPYLRGRQNYGSLFRDNFTWLATATIFVALVLTAMQVGLATDQLKENESFMAASYGFTVFAILGPLCVFGLIIFEALYHLLKDLPWLLGGDPEPRESLSGRKR